MLPISVFFFSCYGDHRDLHSFPTRRSSDLEPGSGRPAHEPGGRRLPGRRAYRPGPAAIDPLSDVRRGRPLPCQRAVERSEEHTSELQSQSNLVCRLLLEKKKKKNNTQNKTR